MDARLISQWACAVLIAAGAAAAVSADTFTYFDEQGESRRVEGRLAGSGQGMHALELADGQMLVIPQGVLRERVASDDPAPLSPREVAAKLTEEFGEDGIRTLVDRHYVVGLVLAGPLPARSEVRVAGFLKKFAGFLVNVEDVVTRFCRSMRLETEQPQYPLVTLIFESDRDFDAHVLDASGGQGLSSEQVLGFYSPLTNRLSIRIGECRTFQVPLHEAVHQQVFNRGLLQRLAGVPVWFNEGIATGFENNGERINIGPTKVNGTYAKRLLGEKSLSWEEIVRNDSAFRGDVLAGEAYAHAWGLHWLLVTQHRSNYVRFLRRLGQIGPLEDPGAEERAKLFEEEFGLSVSDLEQDFPRLLQAAIRRQPIRAEETPPGYSLTYGDASEVELNAVQRSSGDGLIEVQGKLRNVSPFRELAYYVTVQTTGGLYADWFLPSVGSMKVIPLPPQPIVKRVPGAPGVGGQAYWVKVRSALPDSDVVAEWKANGFPTPQWQPR